MEHVPMQRSSRGAHCIGDESRHSKLPTRKAQDVSETVSEKLTAIEVQIASVLDPVLDTTSPRALASHGAKIDTLEREKLVLEKLGA